MLVIVFLYSILPLTNTDLTVLLACYFIANTVIPLVTTITIQRKLKIELWHEMRVGLISIDLQRLTDIERDIVWTKTMVRCKIHISNFTCIFSIHLFSVILHNKISNYFYSTDEMVRINSKFLTDKNMSVYKLYRD